MWTFDTHVLRQLELALAILSVLKYCGEVLISMTEINHPMSKSRGNRHGTGSQQSQPAPGTHPSPILRF